MNLTRLHEKDEIRYNGFEYVVLSFRVGKKTNKVLYIGRPKMELNIGLFMLVSLILND